jgi:hypothetical protein
MPPGFCQASRRSEKAIGLADASKPPGNRTPRSDCTLTLSQERAGWTVRSRHRCWQASPGRPGAERRTHGHVAAPAVAHSPPSATLCQPPRRGPPRRDRLDGGSDCDAALSPRCHRHHSRGYNTGVLFFTARAKPVFESWVRAHLTARLVDRALICQRAVPNSRVSRRSPVPPVIEFSG